MHLRPFVLWMFVLVAGCQQAKTACPSATSVEAEPVRCPVPEANWDGAYEVWSAENGLVHAYLPGLIFDVGSAQGARYLERKGTSAWSDADLISTEVARRDKLPWADNRTVRWLAGDKVTFHFPYFAEDNGPFSVEIGLRPKVNASMEVRFYRPDGQGGRVWSDPITAQLAPGWHAYHLDVPRDYLADDGMQLMRITFPGTYFEGNTRVAAKFAEIGFGPTESAKSRTEIPPFPARYGTHEVRILSDSLAAWELRAGDSLERYMVVTEGAVLRFNAGPSAWLQAPGKLVIEADYGGERQIASEIALTPGDCWQPQEISLDAMAGQAVRFVVRFEGGVESLSASSEYRADAWISEPAVVTTATEDMRKAARDLENPARIVVLAIDDLRADRIHDPARQRATSNLTKLATAGISGVVMGEGRSFVAMETSFLTTVPATVHGVYDSGASVRDSMTTIAEAVAEKGWTAQFYSTSPIIDASRGYAQGFAGTHAAKGGTAAVLADVLTDVRQSPEKSLFYVHLSELRLPHRGAPDKLAQWLRPNYAGPVTEEAMQRVAVMRDPGPEDAMQFEAYYDAELAGIDEAIGAFARDLPEDTILVVYGTHGCSLGESTLGYEQGLTPWELLTPYFLWKSGASWGIRLDEIVTAAELSATVLEAAGAEPPTGTKSILVPHASHPRADGDGLTATATSQWFYRIRREGVDALFTTGLDGNPAHREDEPHPIEKQALRERIE